MKKKLTIGILKEEKNKWEKRAPLTPEDVGWLVKKGITVKVESNRNRVFKDNQYRQSGAKVVNSVEDTDIIVGIKEPKLEKIYRNKTYLCFSHTYKGQKHNMPLLSKILVENVTLIDYELIKDSHGKRLVHFGRFAGICGLVDSIFYFGKKLEWRNIENPFKKVKPAWKYKSIEDIIHDFEKVDRRIHSRGFSRQIAPFVVAVTGHGNVSQGVQEILDLLHPIEIHPFNIEHFVKHHKLSNKEIYKIVLAKEEKLRAKSGRRFYFDEYLRHPDKFESNLDKYLPHVNILINGSYWDGRYPKMVTKDMIKKLYRRKNFRLDFISDISCDIGGSIEINCSSTDPEHPTYTYMPRSDRYRAGYEASGITLAAVDNWPTELPRESSEHFSELIKNYVYQLALNGKKSILRNSSIDKNLRQAVMTSNGRLTKDYKYLYEDLI